MPLNQKGAKVLGHMEQEYGPEKGKQAFYASEKSGKLKGIRKGYKPGEKKSKAKDARAARKYSTATNSFVSR
jgi:hypothetical protein